MKHTLGKFALILAILLSGFIQAAAQTDPLECIIMNKKMGLRDRVTKAVVIPCKYDLITVFDDGLYKVRIGGFWGVIDKTGKTVMSAKFNEIKSFGKNTIAPAKTADKWGVINKTGKFVIPEKYEDIVAVLDNGCCVVKLNGKWGMIDKNQTTVIDFKYDEPLFFKDGYARAKRGGLYGIVNDKGVETVPCRYKKASFIHDNLMHVSEGDKWGFIDLQGNLIIPMKYFQSFDEFHNNAISLRDLDGAHIVAIDSRIIASFPGKDIYALSKIDYNTEKHYVVRNMTAPFRKYIVNSKGERITSVDYQDVGYSECDNMINVKMYDKWGIVGTDGRMVLDYKYDDMALSHDSKGVAVKLGDKWGMVDLAGRTLIPFEYDIIDQNFVFSKLIKGGKMGAANGDAKLILPVIYDDISYPDRRLGYFPVKLNDVDGYADFYGNDTF